MKKLIIILFFLSLVSLNSFGEIRPIPDIIKEGILKYEGSVFTNDPRDPGGATKYGWTLKTYKMIFPGANVNDLKSMTWEQALELYEDHFWVVHGTQYIRPDSLAGTLLLAQINMGASRPNKLLQQVCNELCDCNLKIDGLLGKMTVYKVNNCSRLDDAYPYILWHDKYMPLVNKMPYYKKGWRNRALHYAQDN